MPEKMSKEKPRRRRVTISLKAPEAKGVNLAGDFNKWDSKTHPMKKGEDGVWKKIVMLYPGRYEYKFLVDSRWQTDPKNDQACKNCFGTQNNILTIP